MDLTSQRVSFVADPFVYVCVCGGGVLFKSMILRLDYQGSHPGSAPIWPYTWMRHFFSSVPQFPNLQNASNSGIYLNRLFWE